jgi:hypothetical protein
MKKLTVGVVCIGMANFEARSYQLQEKTRTALANLPEGLLRKAELHLYPALVETVAEAQRAKNWFSSSGKPPVDLLMIQASSLAMGDLLYPLFDISKDVGFWSIPEPTYEGDLRLNSYTGINLAISIHRKAFQPKHPGSSCKWFHGWPGDTTFDSAFRCTIDALHARLNLRNSRIGQLGATVPTFDNLTFDVPDIRRSLGAEIVSLDIDEIVKRVKDVSDAQAQPYAEAITSKARRILVEPDWLLRTGKILHAIHQIREEYQFQSLALRCWPEFQSDLDIAPCVAVAALNESGIPTSCEGDTIGSLSMYTAWLVSQQPVTMNDLVAFDPGFDTLQMWHCGPGPVSWADDDGQTIDYHHTLNRRKAPGEAKTGLSSDMVFRNGPVTVMRYNDRADGLLAFEAEIVPGPAKPFKGTGGWFSTFTCGEESYRAQDILQTIAAHGFEHHYPVARGHIEQVYHEMAYWMNLSVTPLQRWKPYAKFVSDTNITHQ